MHPRVSRAPPTQQTLRLDGRPLLVTYHPSAVLRADERAAEVRAALVADLTRLRELLAG